MIPARLSLISLNLWLTQRWPERAPALEQLLRLFRPDILCLQELQPQTQRFVDSVLGAHKRVQDPFPGWTNESNIYWNDTLLEAAEYGAEKVGHVEPERRLFWARLRLRASGSTLFVATAHLTSHKTREEMETGLSPRVGQLQRIAEHLSQLVHEREPAFFMGDMNDVRHPQRILREAGFVSTFSALGLQSPPTFHCLPTAGIKPGEPIYSEAIDFIFANANTRAVAASVPQCLMGGLAPSDHWPVQAVYEIA